MEKDSSEQFNSWGILELFGHLKLAGRLSEQTVGGCAFIRIDVPEIGEAQPFTRYFTSGAIYSMTPTTERVARAVASNLRAVPVSVQTGNRSGIHTGASLRDHFAGLAMQALLSPNHPWGGYPEKGIPRVAYEMADAMLLERAKENGA